MALNYLWDTNTVIYYLQQQFPSSAEKFIDGILKTEQPIFSAITEIELLCWKTPNENDLKAITQFIENSMVIELEREIKLQTVEIRKLHNIKIPVAIIAATALVYNLTLLTRNIQDFKSIDSLKIINVWEM